MNKELCAPFLFGRNAILKSDKEKTKHMITLICYDKCTTCRKAQKWLDANNIPYTIRPIKEENPTKEELKKWIPLSGKETRKFFNTSGQLYRSMKLSEKVKTMSNEEMLNLLASDGMMVKRPIALDGDTVLVGFKEAEWEVLKK